MKKPGRFKLRCVQCEKEFSTHSTNRTACHKCVPKCREQHLFTRTVMPTQKTFDVADAVQVVAPEVSVAK